MNAIGNSIPECSIKGTTPVQKPRYKLDINLDYVEETCQLPTDYYDKCNSKPCTKCTPEQKCTEPTKRNIDPTKCVRRKHYIIEPSLYGFEGDPWYGWSTIGEERPKDEEGPYSMVTLQPYGYPNAPVIVLLNDTEPHNFAPPTALSGLQRLNKFPNRRGILLPDCQARDNQKECSTIGCPSFITPGSFNPATGRYTPKMYYPPHFHTMHAFLQNKAIETGTKDLGYTYDTCYKYPPDMDYETTAQRDVFGFCQEGPCGQPHKYKDEGKCQYIDCPAKSVCVPKEPEAEGNTEDYIIEGEDDDTDIRPGHVVIEHGISRRTCCFDESVSSSGSEDGSLLSASAALERYGRDGKGGRRISWDEEIGEQESEESVRRHFQTLISCIDFESKRKRGPFIDEPRTGGVPHRRCTWGTMHDTDLSVDMRTGSPEAHHISVDILNELLSRGSQAKSRAGDEARHVSEGILDGILGLEAHVAVHKDFDSHEPPKPSTQTSRINATGVTHKSRRKKHSSKERGSDRSAGGSGASRRSGKRRTHSKDSRSRSRGTKRSGTRSGRGSSGKKKRITDKIGLLNII